MKALTIFLLMSTVVWGQDYAKHGVDGTTYVPTGLSVGDRAPEIVGESIHGEAINSTAILKEKQIVLLFYRGKWCPVCNRYLSNINDSLNYIIARNAVVIVVGTETPENTLKMKEKVGGDFTMIADTSMQVLKDYDVLFNVTKKYQNRIKTFLLTDIAKNNGQQDAQLPVPATYIIDQTGRITYKHFDYDYGTRASVKSILEQL